MKRSVHRPTKPRGPGIIENKNMAAYMAAWCVASPLRLTFFFLLFYEVLAIKVNVRGANHICSSGAQVFHVNFGNGPIHQCDVMNTTPPSNNGKPSCAEKAKERLKSSQGLYDSVKWGVSYHVNNLVNYKAPLLKISSRGFCPFMFCCTVHVFVSNFRLQFFEVLVIFSRRLI